MEEYRYPKSGYTYYAVKLIYGERSPHREQFSVFGLPPHSDKRMRYSETEERRPSDRGPGINESLRYLNVDGIRVLHTHRTESTGINTALTYRFTRGRTIPRGERPQIDVVSDIMFSQAEYDYFNFKWDDQEQYKVDILARLIMALDMGDQEAFPMFIDDFPEVAKYHLSGKPYLDIREPLWKHA